MCPPVVGESIGTKYRIMIDTMRIILASGSPRRKMFIDSLGIEYVVEQSEFDEYLDDDLIPEEVAQALARGKAQKVANNYAQDYVLGADTIVAVDGKQYGKPVDAAEAKDMLLRISGRTHQVVTGVALININNNVLQSFADTAHITFGVLPIDVIDAYIATNDPYDKGGGYTMQHPLLKPYITQITGDPMTIIGLPLRRVHSMLVSRGFVIPYTAKQSEERFLTSTHQDLRILH